MARPRFFSRNVSANIPAMGFVKSKRKPHHASINSGKNMSSKFRSSTLARFNKNSFAQQPVIRGQHQSAATSDLIRVHKELAPYT